VNGYAEDNREQDHRIVEISVFNDLIRERITDPNSSHHQFIEELKCAVYLISGQSILVLDDKDCPARHAPGLYEREEVRK
jgi:hypothetical protein